MPTLTILLLFVLAAAPAQRIETQFPDRARVTRVETAMNHLTVIELAEPVTLAAAGSPLFKIERRENKVFIQPLEEGASTNLFVWTGIGTMELRTGTGRVTGDHAFCDRSAGASRSRRARTWQRRTDPTSDADVFSVVCRGDASVCKADPKSRCDSFGPTEVGVFITDVYRKDDQLFIRYVIDNRHDTALSRSACPKCSRSSPRSRQLPCIRSGIRRSVADIEQEDTQPRTDTDRNRRMRSAVGSASSRVRRSPGS